ncbi:YebC/PmpR family DNA-binding transcriptional regulator, partial [Candidatus Gottesmanbacteria bacterium]|nr:YebC/PmpR family DNA-binding transcriptional regulator [Candidatus Gottesmanbacteria bacterium]
MSGHSKWSKVKHQKETTDAAKGKVFTKFANAITIAV